MTLRYLCIEDVLDTHRRTVEISGGGALGHRDLGILESALAQIQNDDYYPTFVKKLTHLFFACNKFHCFEDGNKRIAISVGTQFLLYNGYVSAASRFMPQMENISYHVAAGLIDKDFLRDLIEAVIDDAFDDNEALTMRLCVVLEEYLGQDGDTDIGIREEEQ